MKINSILGGIVRHVITGGAAATALQAWSSGEKLNAAINAVVAFGGVALSVLHKLEAEVGNGLAVLSTLKSTAQAAVGPTIPVVGTALALVLLCGGCALGVPANRIAIRAPSGQYLIETPKNVEITQFNASVDTNGIFSVKFDRWSSTNDPQVVDKATAGRVAELQALGGIAGTIAEKAVQGAK